SSWPAGSAWTGRASRSWATTGKASTPKTAGAGTGITMKCRMDSSTVRILRCWNKIGQKQNGFVAIAETRICFAHSLGEIFRSRPFGRRSSDRHTRHGDLKIPAPGRCGLKTTRSGQRELSNYRPIDRKSTNMKTTIPTIANILLRLSPILALLFLFLWLRSCNTASQQVDRYQTNLDDREREIRSYRLSNGQLMQEKELLSVTTKELRNQVWARDASLKRLMRKLMDPVVAVQWKTSVESGE